jgi:hypothetical protein
MNDYNPLRDRNYYRQFNDYDLLELAKSVKTTELELVLVERLREAKNEKYYPNKDI